MIDLAQELSGALPDLDASSGAVDRARTAARHRRGRRRAGYVVISALILVLAIAGIWAVRPDRRGSGDVAAGPGVGADAPTSLTVTCTADGPVLSSDTVQVGPAGVTVEFRNATDALVDATISSGQIGVGSSGHGLSAAETERAVELTPPGPATIRCGPGRATAPNAQVLLVDPNGYYGSASLELDCRGGSQAVVDLTGNGSASSTAELPLRDLLSADALGDHTVKPSGYPAAVPRPYAVVRDGKTVAVAGYQPTSAGLVLVELHACSSALLHR